MAKKPTYPLKSTMLRGKKAWFYQDRNGLTVVAQKWDRHGNYHGCTIAGISWTKICAAVDNHRAVQKRLAARR